MATQALSHELLQACAEIHQSLDLGRTKEAIVRNLAQLFRAKGASLLLYSPGNSGMQVEAAYGLSKTYLDKGPISPDKSLRDTIMRVPVLVPDVSQDPRVQYKEAAAQEGIKCIVGLPLSAGRLLVGSLRLYFSQTRWLGEDEMEALQGLARQAGLALKKAFYFATLHSSLPSIHRMPVMHSFNQTLYQLLQAAANSLHASGCALYLMDGSNHGPKVVSSYGLRPSALAQYLDPDNDGLDEVNSGQPLVVSDLTAQASGNGNPAAGQDGIRAIIGLPLALNNHAAGALRFYFQFTFEPDQDDLMWMSHLARQIEIALEKDQALISLKADQDDYRDLLEDMEAQYSR